MIIDVIFVFLVDLRLFNSEYCVSVWFVLDEFCWENFDNYYFNVFKDGMFLFMNLEGFCLEIKV